MEALEESSPRRASIRSGYEPHPPDLIDERIFQNRVAVAERQGPVSTDAVDVLDAVGVTNEGSLARDQREAAFTVDVEFVTSLSSEPLVRRNCGIDRRGEFRPRRPCQQGGRSCDQSTRPLQGLGHRPFDPTITDSKV